MNETSLIFYRFNVLYSVKKYIIMEKNHRFNTVPATEENLTLEIDSHPFNPAPSEEISDDFDVIVDGYIGKAGGVATEDIAHGYELN